MRGSRRWDLGRGSRAAHAFVLTVAAYSAGLPAISVAQVGAGSDRAALVALYEATGGDTWTDNANWLSDAPLGEWSGVDVNEDGRVTGLRLGGWDDAAQNFIDHGLTGSLPAELGTLSHLRRLEIGGNAGLVGPIPAELSSLSRLDVLNLQANRLTGPIPPGLGYLPDLEELWVSRNPLSGQVPTELQNLTALTFLDLRNTLLSGPLPEGLTRLSALTWLQLEGSGLCVPDAPDFEAWVAAIRDFTGAICVGSPTFLWVVTPPGPGPLDRARRRRPADLHLKSATSGDIEGDGDVDLWVDSIGGRNVSSHFMVNNGDGTFTVDEARAPPVLRYNWPEGWYHRQGRLVDLDDDGDLDLALGQSRKITPENMNQFSIVMVNDFVVPVRDPGGLSASQLFAVTVSATATRSFTDHPLRPGVTPIRAIHFTEFRAGIDALRSAAGLTAFSWTDPALTAGVTPVRLVHLLDLRRALAEAYEAEGRGRPQWADVSPAPGTIPIRALHLRAAVAARMRRRPVTTKAGADEGRRAPTASRRRG